MKMTMLLVILAVGASGIPGAAQDKAKGAKAAAAPAAAHVLVTPGDVKWGPAPPVLPAGAQVAVLDGDPFKPGFFTLRLKFPDGYTIPAHWHPTDENITVLQGTFRAGMGNAHSNAGLHDFPAGSFVKMPKKMNHFATARGEVIVQIYGQGPFVVNYVNPADNPAKKTTTR